jgi:hypothetical protein
MHRRQGLLILALAVFVLYTAESAAAAQSHTDAISGHEYFFTSTDGKFAGSASGTLSGHWNADVQHTPLCGSCTPTATITGGSFQLLHGISTLITGDFTGGSVQVTNPGAGCTNQTFAVRGVLGSVGPWHSGNGSGLFSVTLTHYRVSILGSCITYAASVAGVLTLTY